MRYLSKSLSSDLDRKIKFIYGHGPEGRDFKDHLKYESNLLCQQLEKHAIEKNAQIHSFRIEYEGRPVPFNVPKNGKAIKEGIMNLKNSFDWGNANFDPDNFDEYFIRRLAKKIEPNLIGNDYAEYRDSGTVISGAKIIPPDPWKVKNIEMPKFVENLKREFKSGKGARIRIMTAIGSHLHLSRIHPFTDGNGRTARALQDTILTYYKIPLPVIEAGEREIYYQLIANAQYDWKHLKNSGIVPHGATEGEKGFYTFMAGKINASIDKIIDKCDISKF